MDFDTGIYVSTYDSRGNELSHVMCATRAQQRRIQLAERAKIVAALGLAPEGNTAGDKYIGTTGELLADLRALFHVPTVRAAGKPTTYAIPSRPVQQ